MSHKTMVRVAIFMIVIFVVTIVVYPMIFNPDSQTDAPLENVQEEMPTAPPIIDTETNTDR